MVNSKLDAVVRNIPDPSESHLVRVTLEEMARSTPTMAEAWAEQLEEKQRREAGNVAQNKDSGIELRTQDVIDSLLNIKRYKGLGENTINTYVKKLNQFNRAFPQLPDDPKSIIGYLNKYNGKTGRHKRNHHDLLHMLYEHAIRNFGWQSNPLDFLERPLITKRPFKTLSLEQVRKMNKTPESLIERVCLDLLLGHGWRQVEVRRIIAKDIANIRDGLIWCRGKEREEWTPILRETEQRLKELAQEFNDNEQIIVSKKSHYGKRRALGEDGIAQLVARLYARAAISGMTGHELRKSFATLVTAASRDEFIAMRLLRDKIPGQSDRYINYSMPLLQEALQRYSPLRLIKQKEAGSDQEPAKMAGGDGGELNSPSRRSCPGYPTGFVSSLVLSDSPQLTELNRASRFIFHCPYRRQGDGTPALRHPIPTRRGEVRLDGNLVN
jgi:integrase